MNRRARRLLTCAAVATIALATGCKSSRPAGPAPAASDAPDAPDAPDRGQGAAAGRSVSNRPSGNDDTITVRKGEHSRTEATYLSRSSQDNVSIDVKNADIARVILPIFKNQCGVWIEYAEKTPRKLGSLLIQDLPWREALGILCRMSYMHVVPVEGSRVLEMRDGYEDPQRIVAHWRPDRPATTPEQRRYGVDPTPVATPGGSSGASGSPTGSYGGGSAPSGGGGGSDPGSSRGADQIDALRRGVGTTNSGGR